MKPAHKITADDQAHLSQLLSSEQYDEIYSRLAFSSQDAIELTLANALWAIYFCVEHSQLEDRQADRQFLQTHSRGLFNAVLRLHASAAIDHAAFFNHFLQMLNYFLRQTRKQVYRDQELEDRYKKYQSYHAKKKFMIAAAYALYQAIPHHHPALDILSAASLSDQDDFQKALIASFRKRDHLIVSCYSRIKEIACQYKELYAAQACDLLDYKPGRNAALSVLQFYKDHGPEKTPLFCAYIRDYLVTSSEDSSDDDGQGSNPETVIESAVKKVAKASTLETAMVTPEQHEQFRRRNLQRIDEFNKLLSHSASQSSNPIANTLATSLFSSMTYTLVYRGLNRGPRYIIGMTSCVNEPLSDEIKHFIQSYGNTDSNLHYRYLMLNRQIVTHDNTATSDTATFTATPRYKWTLCSYNHLHGEDLLELIENLVIDVTNVAINSRKKELLDWIKLTDANDHDLNEKMRLKLQIFLNAREKSKPLSEHAFSPQLSQQLRSDSLLQGCSDSQLPDNADHGIEVVANQAQNLYTRLFSSLPASTSLNQQEALAEVLESYVKKYLKDKESFDELLQEYGIGTNPFVSTALQARRAYFYASGVRFTGKSAALRGDPHYRFSTGKPKHRYQGFVRAFAVNKKYLTDFSIPVLNLVYHGKMKLNVRYQYETEVIFLGVIPSEYYVADIPFYVPDLPQPVELDPDAQPLKNFLAEADLLARIRSYIESKSIGEYTSECIERYLALKYPQRILCYPTSRGIISDRPQKPFKSYVTWQQLDALNEVFIQSLDLPEVLKSALATLPSSFTVHGPRHAARAAIWAEILIGFYLKKNKLSNHPRFFPRFFHTTDDSSTSEVNSAQAMEKALQPIYDHIALPACLKMGVAYQKSGNEHDALMQAYRLCRGENAITKQLRSEFLVSSSEEKLAPQFNAQGMHHAMTALCHALKIEKITIIELTSEHISNTIVMQACMSWSPNQIELTHTEHVDYRSPIVFYHAGLYYPLQQRYPLHYDTFADYLIVAAAMHDSGRESDKGNDQPEWELASSRNFERLLLENGLTQNKAYIDNLKQALVSKDYQDDVPYYVAKMVAHDADALEIMRVQKPVSQPQFEPAMLYLFQYFDDADIRQDFIDMIIQIAHFMHAQGEVRRAFTIAGVPGLYIAKSTTRPSIANSILAYQKTYAAVSQTPLLRQYLRKPTELADAPPRIFSGKRKNDKEWYSNDDIRRLNEHSFRTISHGPVELFAAHDIDMNRHNMLAEQLMEFHGERALQISQNVHEETQIGIPIRIDQSHWAVLWLTYEAQTNNLQKVCYVDSLGKPMHSEIREALSYPDLFPNLKQEQIIESQQRFQFNSYDCGPWTVVIIQQLLRGTDVSQLSGDFDMHAIRSEHARILETNQYAPTLFASSAAENPAQDTFIHQQVEASASTTVADVPLSGDAKRARYTTENTTPSPQ